MRTTFRVFLCVLALLAPTAFAQAQQAAQAGTSPGTLPRHAVQAAQHRYQALLHTIPQAKSWPDPQLSVGWMGDPAPFRVMQNLETDEQLEGIADPKELFTTISE